jgi:transposase
MAGISKRPKLSLAEEDLRELQALSRSSTAEARVVRRARILVSVHAGMNVSAIAKSIGMTRVSVRKWIDRALAVGPMAALKDAYHRPREPTITDEARAWVTSVACTKPKELGYAAELWTRSSLAKHVRRFAEETGHPSLKNAAKATVHRILAANKLHPEKIKYYLERRDPEFDEKRRQVLLVYRAIALQNEGRRDNPHALPPAVVTVSVDEKPGVQAIGNTAVDRPPVPGKHGKTARDHEYERFGTCSILAALDLHDGHITARVERKASQHRVHPIAPRSGCLLPTRVQHSNHSG